MTAPVHSIVREKNLKSEFVFRLDSKFLSDGRECGYASFALSSAGAKKAPPWRGLHGRGEVASASFVFRRRHFRPVSKSVRTLLSTSELSRPLETKHAVATRIPILISCPAG